MDSPQVASPWRIRDAVRRDLPAIVGLLRDDPLGRGREAPDDASLDRYHQAFDAIATDPNNELLVVEASALVIAVLQVTYTPGLSRQGAWRATLEGVRVAPHARGRGVGRSLVAAAAARAVARGCRLLQLTTDRSRTDAMRFYAALGFEATHVGFKRTL